MNFPEHEPQSFAIPGCALAESGSYGLLLSRDLIFTTKIKATAAELGYQIQVAGDVMLARSLIAEQRPRVVLIDLTAGDLCTRRLCVIIGNWPALMPGSWPLVPTLTRMHSLQPEPLAAKPPCPAANLRRNYPI